MFTRLRAWLRLPGPTSKPPLAPLTLHARTVRTAALNGVLLGAASDSTTVLSDLTGAVHETEHQGWVLLGDGTLCHGLHAALVRCPLCAAEAHRNEADTPEQALLRSLCHAKDCQRSALSGVRVCAAHARTIPTPAGPLTVTTAEAAALAAKQHQEQRWRRITALFVESDP